MSVQVLFSVPDLTFITSYLSNSTGSLFLLVETIQRYWKLVSRQAFQDSKLEQSLLFSEVNIAYSGMRKQRKSTLLLCLDGDHLGEIIDFFKSSNL